MANFIGTNSGDTLHGSEDADVISGLDSADMLFGHGGNDVIYGHSLAENSTENASNYLDGGAGNDTLYGGAGNDILFGGTGNDFLYGQRGNNLLNGGTGKDTFVFEEKLGTSDADTVLDFNVRSDKIDLSAFGIGSFETLQTLIAGTAIDSNSDFYTGNVLQFRYNSNSYMLELEGVSFSDLSASNFILSQSAANENSHATGYEDQLFGGNGNDRLFGDKGNDVIFGEAGDDRLYGGSSAASANMSDGNDVLFGGEGNDSLYGGDGNDYIRGGIGEDVLYADAGSDTMQGDAGKDVFVLGSVQTMTDETTDVITDFNLADDRIDVSALGISDIATLRDLFIASADRATTLELSFGGTTYDLKIENVDKSQLDASDFIFHSGTKAVRSDGTAGQDYLFGSRGNDALNGNADYDHLWGASGNDKLDGGDGYDRLFGGSGNDTLSGGAGTDMMRGDAGNDVLVGGASDDILIGGAGRDTFVYTSTTDSYSFYDQIRDFEDGIDKIDLSKIDPGVNGTGNAFNWSGVTDDVAEGSVGYRFREGYTYVTAENDESYMTIKLLGYHELSASDFVL